MRCWDYRWKKVSHRSKSVKLELFCQPRRCFFIKCSSSSQFYNWIPKITFFQVWCQLLSNNFRAILSSPIYPSSIHQLLKSASLYPLFSFSLSFVFLSRPNGINYFYIRRQFWGHFLPSGYTVAAAPAASVVTFVFSFPVVAETVAAVHRCTVPKVPPLLSYTVFPFWQLK